jgi:microcystin-dependent protein
MAIAGLGSGLTNRVLGSATGTETVTPSIATMAVHNHAITPSDVAPLGNAPDQGNNNQTFAGVDSLGGFGLANTGGGTPANTMQPTTFMNVMVKL